MSFIHAYPGLVNTGLLTTNMPGYVSFFTRPLAPLLFMTPAKCASDLLEGVRAARKLQEGGSEVKGKNWWNLSLNKVLTKKEVGDEMRDKVEEHTWEMVDGNSNGSQ